MAELPLHIASPAELGGLTLPEILGLQAGPPETKLVLRYEESVDAKRSLVKNQHPVHAQLIATDEEGRPIYRDKAVTVAIFENEMYDFVGSPGFCEVPVRPEDADPATLSWFTKHGPQLGQILSIVTPDEENGLPPAWATLSGASAAQVHLKMGCLIDPNNQNGPSKPGRPVPLDDSKWLQSGMSSVYRDGLASDPEQMLAHHAVNLPYVDWIVAVAGRISIRQPG